MPEFLLDVLSVSSGLMTLARAPLWLLLGLILWGAVKMPPGNIVITLSRARKWALFAVLGVLGVCYAIVIPDHFGFLGPSKDELQASLNKEIALTKYLHGEADHRLNLIQGTDGRSGLKGQIRELNEKIYANEGYVDHIEKISSTTKGSASSECTERVIG